MKPIKKGGQWRNRRGEKVLILTAQCDGEACIAGLSRGEIQYYRPDGTWSTQRGVETPYDLIEPWKPKKKRAMEVWIRKDLLPDISLTIEKTGLGITCVDRMGDRKWRKFREVLGEKEGE